MEYLYRQAGRQLELSEDSTQQLEEFNDMDERFVDDSMTAPSMSEHELMVGAGLLEEEEGEEEVRVIMFIRTAITHSYNVRLIPPLLPSLPPLTSLQTPGKYQDGIRLNSWQSHL